MVSHALPASPVRLEEINGAAAAIQRATQPFACVLAGCLRSENFTSPSVTGSQQQAGWLDELNNRRRQLSAAERLSGMQWQRR